MMVTDEDALICDLAETYGIYDMKSLPIVTVATFSIGLKGDSRIMRKIAGMKVDYLTLLQAAVLDRLSFLAWTKTKDAQHGLNRPESLVEKLMENKKEPEYQTFSTGEEFDKRLRELRRSFTCRT